MKIQFRSISFTLCYLCLFITPSFAVSQIYGNASVWRSSINIKSQQITINAQNNLFTINLFIFVKKKPILQILYKDKNNITQDIQSLNFTIDKQVFTLKKQVINIRNQAQFDTTLTTPQLQILIQGLSTQKNAYITGDHDKMAFSLKGSYSVITSLLQYLDQHPSPALLTFFNKITPPPHSSWFNFPLQQNKLLYGMGCIVFLLLFGRPLLKIITYIYKKRKYRYLSSKALKIANSQIKQNANILYIKRDQLLYSDEYGSLIEDKWIQEVHRFIRTKIKPLLTEQHLLEYYPSMQKIIVKQILFIAKNPSKTKKTFFNKLKKSKIKYSSTMNPFDYETYCAELLRAIGWNANVTTASGDQGADVVAIKKGITLIIQCKLYSKPVNNKAVQEVNAAKIFYHAHYAAVVSNASYTTSARQLAGSTEITLLHHENLQKFARTLA